MGASIALTSVPGTTRNAKVRQVTAGSPQTGGLFQDGFASLSLCRIQEPVNSVADQFRLPLAR